MQNDVFDMHNAVLRWEAIHPDRIKALFERYLFPILKWANREKQVPFTVKEIDNYKGVAEQCPYPYAKRIRKSMPVFQLTESFCAGHDFFEMVDYYTRLTDFVQQRIDDYYKIVLKENLFESKNDKKSIEESEFENKSGKKILQDVFNKKGTKGFNYALELFECSVYCYYDKFHNLDRQVLNQFFVWAMMLRVDMQTLSRASVNCYAVGDADNKGYTNNIPIFLLIRQARIHTQLSELSLKTADPEDVEDTDWKELNGLLRVINGD
jgi:hypothetical protein